MKNLRSVLLGTTLATAMLLSFTSCNDKEKKEDTMKVAEEHNDAKFDDNKEKENDATFLVNAAEMNLAQIELGKLVQKSANADTKAFGKMMETDHGKSWTELEALAAKKQITVPTAVTEDGKEVYENLNKKTGADFDKAYADLMVEDHKKAITEFEAIAKDSKDTEIVAWANEQLASIRQHLDKAIAWQTKIKK